jgi:nitronate monooxygenase
VTLQTPLTEVLGVEYPVVQAPIGSATSPDLAAAVADAGGLGTLAVTWRDRRSAGEAVAETLDRTDGPVAVNVVVDPATGEVPPERLVESCLAAGCAVFAFSFGSAAPYVEWVHDRGGVVLQTVGSAEEATAAVEAGVDVVVAQGWEAGGHVQSEVATSVLVPRVADAVDVPVVAAGGIGDGRGIAAALALGADGAWLGTRFLATEEAHVHCLYRERVLNATETDTVHGQPYPEGWPGVDHRVLENETVREWAAAGRPDTDRPGAGDVVARGPDGDPVERYEDSLAVPGMDGDVEAVPLYAGQSAALAGETVPAGDLVATLVDETAATLDRLQGL